MLDDRESVARRRWLNVRCVLALTVVVFDPSAAWPERPFAPADPAEAYFCNACARPQTVLRIELLWSEPSVDLDLHVLRPPGPRDRRVFYARKGSREPAWGVLDCDVPIDLLRRREACLGGMETFLIERATDRPTAGLLYRFAVHDYSGEKTGQKVEWTLRVTLDDESEVRCHGAFGGSLELASSLAPAEEYLAAPSGSARRLHWSPVLSVVLPAPGTPRPEIEGCTTVGERAE